MMRAFNLRYLALVLLACAIGNTSRVSAGTIDFEDFAARGITPMGNSPGSAVPLAAQLSNQYLASDGVTFKSTVGYVAVVGGATPSTGIGGVSSGGLLSYADPVFFTFFLPGTSTAATTTEVKISADSIGTGFTSGTLTGFDLLGNEIVTETLADTGGETWDLKSSKGIHSVMYTFIDNSHSAFGNGTGIALDDLIFGTPTVSVSATPLPSALTAGIFIGLFAVLVQWFQGRPVRKNSLV
jgi:hypothetical protein